MVQKIIEIYCRIVKRRVHGKTGEDEQCCESQVAKIRNLGNSQVKFGSPPALEHMQQHKTEKKNDEKISLKMRKFTLIKKKNSIENFENLRILRKILI